jgi:hypothetical protein
MECDGVRVDIRNIDGRNSTGFALQFTREMFGEDFLRRRLLEPIKANKLHMAASPRKVALIKGKYFQVSYFMFVLSLHVYW